MLATVIAVCIKVEMRWDAVLESRSFLVRALAVNSQVMKTCPSCHL